MADNPVKPTIRPLCGCHALSMHRNGHNPNGSASWVCAVYNNAKSATDYELRRDEIAERKRKRYDSDPIFRISKNLHDHARRRRLTIERRKQALREETSGSV